MVDVIVQRAKAAAVDSVMIGGRWVLRRGNFISVDRDAILAEISERMSRRTTEVENARAGLAESVFPEVRRFYEANPSSTDF
jgi:hypothetical protein